jgi:acyl-homoserine-lactone acylase
MAADGWPDLHLLTVFTLRTKARNDTGFRCVIDLGTNSSNNTVYADAGGNIAYFQGNFIPVNDPRFDFTQPVNGSDPAAGANSLRREDYPAYL